MDNMNQDVTNELHKLISWFNTNGLHLNASKSTFIIFHANKKQCTQYNHIVIDNTNVCLSGTTNFLGIIIDESFTWLPHFHFMSTKMAKAIGFFIVYLSMSLRNTNNSI